MTTWVMCHITMHRVQHINESRATYQMSHARHIKWVMFQTYISAMETYASTSSSCCGQWLHDRWVMYHISNESCATHQMRRVPDIRFCLGNARLCFAYLIRAMTIYQWVMRHKSMSHAPHINESRTTNQWVTRYISMSHAPHIKWVTRHISNQSSAVWSILPIEATP